MTNTARSVWGLGLVALVAGCGGAAKQVKPPDVPVPVTEAFLALAAGEGIVVAEVAGGTVELRALETGETLPLRDGERVSFRELFAGPGLGRAEAQVLAREQLAVVPNPRLGLEQRFMRLPEQGLVVFSALADCDPACTSEIWILSQEGWRVKVTSDAPSEAVSVAVHPEGRQVAIGAHQLWVVELPAGKVQTWKEFTAPAFDPHGDLIVRGVGPNDAVFELGEFGHGVLLHSEPGAAPSAHGGQLAADPAPVSIESDGRSIKATFKRGGQAVERTFSR